MKVAFTVSSSYSGSTLLSLLLNAQPDIGTVSEFDALGDILRDKDFVCSCGEEIRRCPFFKEVERILNEQGIDFSIERIHEMLEVHPQPLIQRLLVGRLPYFRPRWLEKLRDATVRSIPHYRTLERRFFEKNEALMKAVVELQGATIFLDANKDVYRMQLLARHFDVKPIYIFKNGIAGVYSYHKNAAARGYPWTMEQASRVWFRQQLLICHSLKYFEGDYLQTSYSTLCQDVEGTVRRITEFLGVGFSPARELAWTKHHVIGNRMRLTDLSVIREDERWKSSLSEADIAVYRSVYKQYAPRIRALNEELFGHIWH